MLILSENGYVDILIYVLIMVGGLIANAYRNYAKRKEMEQKPQRQSFPDEQRPAFPDVLFEPVYQYDEPEPEEELEKEEYVNVLDTNQSAIDTIIEESIPVNSYLEGEPAFKDTKSTFVSDDLTIISEINDQDLTASNFFEIPEEAPKPVLEFDLTKAVIYSEILKPKYF